MKTCPNCNATGIPNDAKFCPQCGTPFSSPSNIRTINVLGFEFEMIEVKGGQFMMGETNPRTAWGSDNDAYPRHRVELSSYYIGKYPVTQRLWHLLMDKYGYDNYFYEEYLFHSDIMKFVKEGDNYPMVYVCYDQVQDFIRVLNSMTGLRFSLPTEAQWEFAARGGTLSQNYIYSGSNNWDEVGWFYGNSGRQSLDNRDWNHQRAMQNGCALHEVGKKLPNELGIYDMSGNCKEICEDVRAPYSEATVFNPKGPAPKNPNCILGIARGGTWRNVPSPVTERLSAFRDKVNGRDYEQGFRLVLNIYK